jgi:hypothetical protein
VYTDSTSIGSNGLAILPTAELLEPTAPDPAVTMAALTDVNGCGVVDDDGEAFLLDVSLLNK